MENIIASVIVGVLTLLGVVITNVSSNRAVENKIMTTQEVLKTELSNLRREVEKHNNFANRIPVIEEQIKGIDRRVEDLEKK